MAYTTIDNPELYFQTKLYTGNGGTQSITFDGSEDMRPDFVWLKSRGGEGHVLFDSVRGGDKAIKSESNVVENTGNCLQTFDSDGFGFTNGSDGNSVHSAYNSYCSWSWSAGGASPAITYTVKVVSDSGNKYRFDDFGTSAVTLELQEGGTYTFDQSDSSNATHPLRFYTASDKSGGEYTTGVTTTGTAGSSGAKTVITVAASAPTLYYQCSSHSGMGGQVNTNSTFGSSNFSGSIQSTVSSNISAGFSIVAYKGNNTAGATVGHGLNAVPHFIMIKNRDFARSWLVGSKGLPSWSYHLYLDTNDDSNSDNNMFNGTTPTSSVFSLGNADEGNQNEDNMIAYIWSEKQGYSKFGSYTGNASSSGSYIHLGFKPAYVMVKGDRADNWQIMDNKRLGYNVISPRLEASTTSGEYTNLTNCDFTAQGFKVRSDDSHMNYAEDYFYIAFAESPFVNSKGVPTNAE